METRSTSKAMKLLDYKNIAILQTAFIGDIVLTMPLVQAVRNSNPEAKITFITTPVAREIPKICNAVSEVIVFDKHKQNKGIKQLIYFGQNLSRNEFDLWICPHRSFRSTIVSLFQKKSLKIGFDTSSFSSVFDISVKYRKDKHEIERNLELISDFGIDFVNLKDVETNIDKNDVNLEYLEITEQKKYVIIAPGSVWGTKKWKEDYYAELSIKLMNNGFKVILSGSKSDEALCDRIALKTGAVSLAGKTNISTTLFLIKSAKLVITNDSAPTHFAGLMNTPVITIYGPTSPIFGFGPRSDNSIIIYNEDLKCSPCRIHGSNKCPIGTHICMTSIKPDFVLNGALKLLNN